MKIKNFIEKSLISSLYMVANSFQNELEAKFKHLDLNYVEALILTTLFFEDDANITGPTRLANALGIKKARSSQAITKLQKQGYLDRTLSSGDSRRFEITLTPLGKRKSQLVIKIFNQMEEQFEGIIGSSRANTVQKDLKKLALALMTKT